MNLDAVKLKIKLTKSAQQALVSISAIVITLALSMLIVRLMDIDPVYAFGQMITGSLGSLNAFSEVMVKMSPLLFTGMSYALANRCGMTNLGMEGQLYMGAICATAVGIHADFLPMALHLPLSMSAGFIGGALWGYLAGFLKVKYNASEVITTVMMNTIAINFCGYMVSGPMVEGTGKTQTAPIAESATLPRLFGEGPMRAHLGFFIAIAFILLFWVFLNRTKKGFEVRMTGMNIHAATYVGINTDRNIMLVMALAGGLAGMAGANEILGVQMMMLPNISPGYGFDGVAVSMIGQNSPFGIIIGAFLFGILRAGGNMMQRRAKVPVSIISVIQGLVIISVVASNILLEKWNESQLKAKKTAGEKGDA